MVPSEMIEKVHAAYKSMRRERYKVEFHDAITTNSWYLRAQVKPRFRGREYHPRYNPLGGGLTLRLSDHMVQEPDYMTTYVTVEPCPCAECERMSKEELAEQAAEYGECFDCTKGGMEALKEKINEFVTKIKVEGSKWRKAQ